MIKKKEILKDVKCVLRFERLFYSNNYKDVEKKLKYNSHLLKLIKNVKKINECHTSYKEDSDVYNLDVAICYLYKNVNITYENDFKKNRYNNYISDYNNNKYNNKIDSYDPYMKNDTYKVIINNINNGNSKNKMYLYILNHINIFTTNHVLLILYSFLIYKIKWEHIKKINEHVLNNIYNFKTYELILIQIFFTYFEIKYNEENKRNESRYNFQKGNNISSYAKNHKIENNVITYMSRDMIKYCNSIYYKRKEYLHLNDIIHLCCIYYNYNVYYKELYDYFVDILNKQLYMLNMNKIMENIKKDNNNYRTNNKVIHNHVHMFNTFEYNHDKINVYSKHEFDKMSTIIEGYYYLSSIPNKGKQNMTFHKFSDFINKYKDIITHLNINEVFLLLQLSQNINCVNIKLYILDILSNKLSQGHLVNDHLLGYQKRKEHVEDKNFNKCINIYNSLYQYILIYNNNCENNNRVEIKNICNNLYYNNIYNTHIENKEKSTISLNDSYDIEKNICQNINEKKIKEQKKGKKKEMNFFDHINEYLIIDNIFDNQKYLYILISCLNNIESNNISMVHSLFFFLNSLNKCNKIDLILSYINIISRHINNIYILTYVEYFYKCMTTRVFNNFTAEKVEILMLNMLQFLRHKNGSKFIKDEEGKNEKIQTEDEKIKNDNTNEHIIMKNIRNEEINGCSSNIIKENNLNIMKDSFFYKNEEFLLFLYHNNQHMYEHVRDNLLNIQIDKINNLHEFLFHYIYKNMINYTLLYLTKFIFYINNITILDNILHIFLNIYNYYYIYNNNNSNNNHMELLYKSSILFFQKIILLNFLSIYNNKEHTYNTYHNTLVHKILNIITIDNNNNNNNINNDILIFNYMMNMYFIKNSFCSKSYNENILEYITNMIQPYVKDKIYLKYNNGYIMDSNIKSNINTETYKRVPIKNMMICQMIQNNFNTYVINLLLLLYDNKNFNKIFEFIKEYLYTYATKHH
ncbi:hypothetical protein PRSY57_1458800 [Plasmodium reichenowi]|uniref:Uncharacterized protein n=1 Tax=Plasmodium reichenowi TaxID=5854 RepID=A0A151L5K5_PLARE|nr:hypothetical protein PRSY57_1458800 [Plasmodium reichenowi]KYN94245.1 hypothetical protein PRSY57_1458800 [Plasmodium reichenowi]